MILSISDHQQHTNLAAPFVLIIMIIYPSRYVIGNNNNNTPPDDIRHVDGV